MATPAWFITAASSGFGKAIALEALSRGHKVIATARDSSKLSQVKAAGAAVLDIDVTGDETTLAAKLKEANAIYGKITHVANAAGYVLEGAVEEASVKEVFDQFNTNVFGTFNIARASTPAVAHYCATKAAVSNLTEGLAGELRPFGIDVCVIEPGYTRTELLVQGVGGKERRIVTARQLPVYDGTPAHEAHNALDQAHSNQLNDVEKSAKAIVEVLTKTGRAQGRNVPVRLVLGTDTLAVVRNKVRETLALLEEWEDISASTSHDN